MDEQFLHQLSRPHDTTPLTAASDPRWISKVSHTPNDSPPREPVSLNSTLRRGSRNQSQSQCRSRSFPRKTNVPRSEVKSPLQRDIPLELSNLEELMPLKLFELSLESPFLSKTSIEMPDTFSRAPSIRKKQQKPVKSSQDSIFVAATQFPILCCESSQNQLEATTASLSDFPEIPATQFPPAEPILECSQKIELFESLESSTPEETELELNFGGNEIVALPPSDEEVTNENLPHVAAVEQACTLKVPSAMRKKYGRAASASVGKRVQRVQFAPIPILSTPNIGQSKKNTFNSSSPKSLSAAGVLGSLKNDDRNDNKNDDRNGDKNDDKNDDRNDDRFSQASPRNDDRFFQASPRNDDRFFQASPSIRARLSTPRIPKSLTAVSSSQLTAILSSIPKRVKQLKTLPNKQARKRSRTDFEEEHQRHQQHQQQQQQLGSPLSIHMLVWARWKPLYYAPAILTERQSRTRDIWKIRFCHWKESRSASCCADEFSLCDKRSLMTGDRVLVVRNRKKMQLEECEFRAWNEPASIQIVLQNGNNEIVEISRVLISKKLFISSRQERHLSFGFPITTLGASDSSKKKHPMPLSGYTIWISLGSLPPSIKRTVKSQLVTRIWSLGGIVKEGLEDPAKLKDDLVMVTKRTVLITNGYCRTAKTFLAMILSIPLVRLDWLDACERGEEVASTFAFAIPIPFTNHLDRDLLGVLLQGLNIALEGTKSFITGWSAVCRAASATIIPSYTKLDPTFMSRVLVEQLPSSSSRLARWASQTGISIMTTDWLIDSILSGRRMDYDGP